MSQIEMLVKAFERFVAVPWDSFVAPAQRVWLVVYPPRDERRIRARLGRFELATKEAGHNWKLVDVTDSFARWIGNHAYRETYFAKPELLSDAALKDFERTVQDEVRAALVGDGVDENTLVGLLGAGALFPFTRVSKLVESVAPEIRGRLAVFFPGERDGDNYRLLEARDGWNYLATPITATEEIP